MIDNLPEANLRIKVLEANIESMDKMLTVSVAQNEAIMSALRAVCLVNQQIKATILGCAGMA